MPPDTDYPFTFRCRRSGNCCSIPGGVVRVQPEEVDAIAGHLGMTGSAVRSRFLAASQDRLAEGPSSRCVFLSGGREATCEIYTVRPAKCRSWPYWPELRDNPAYLDRAASLCPGITLDPGSVDTPS